MAISSDAEFNRYSIALRDFEAAQRFLSAAKNHAYGSTEYEALLFAAIISYWRPFSPNEVSKSAAATARLNIQNFGTLSADQMALHETCGRLRNKALAHSEYEYNPTKLNIKTRNIRSRYFSLYGSNRSKGSGNIHDIDLFLQLLTELTRLCHSMRAAYINNLTAGSF